MVFLSIIKNLFRSLFRQVFWLYKLSVSDLGKPIHIEFPVIREGQGQLKLGKNSFLGKKCNFGIGKNANSIFGDAAHIQKNATILVNTDCNLIVGHNFKLGEGSRCFVQNDWQFGDQVKIETNCSIFAREPHLAGRLTIGNDSNIGDYTIIDLVDDLTIGNDVAIGPNCTIYTHDHIYENSNLPAWKGGITSKPIFIEDGAWIGTNVTILPGITIGRRSVVAAGSIVTKNVENNCIYGGNPAKLIKKINDEL